MTETVVFLCLGSNVGGRHGRIAGGIAELEQGAVSVEIRSSVYETEPVGIEDQPWFLNQVIRGTTRLEPIGLLDACKRVESLFGREPTEVRFGPRPLDIDILLYGDRVIRNDRLAIPHPRMHQRRFVLVPLVEIAPRLVDPRNGREYAQILERLDEGKKVSKSSQNES
jgi:2-amino-4-hydroxy-6-hydroxymethyldihydropteridine diphosphokinase